MRPLWHVEEIDSYPKSYRKQLMGYNQGHDKIRSTFLMSAKMPCRGQTRIVRIVSVS